MERSESGINPAADQSPTLSETAAFQDQDTTVILQLQRLRLNLSRFLSTLGDDQIRTQAEGFLAQSEWAELFTMSQEEREVFTSRLLSFCLKSRLQPILALSDIAAPAYNIVETFEENARGPWDRLPLTSQISTPIEWSLLGHPVRFPLGVPASVLTESAEYVRYYARRGFNVITYKTVRSRPFQAHRFPNWVILKDLQEPWFDMSEVPTVTATEDVWPEKPYAFSTANSFGVPSSEPNVWQHDVESSLGELAPGQLLLVSVMGSPEFFSGAELVEDFAHTALLAEQAGAPVIELNLSCPNTVDEQAQQVKAPICQSAEVSLAIVEAVRAAVGTGVKIVAKLGWLPEPELTRVVVAIAPAVHGISGINTVPAIVQTADGQPRFVGTAANANSVRAVAGVSGVAIRELGLDFTRTLARLRQEHGLDFDILAMGGVMSGDDVYARLTAGANCVQAATAAAVNGVLPLELSEYADHSAPRRAASAQELVRAALAEPEWEFRTIDGLSRDTGLQPEVVSRALRALGSTVRRAEVPGRDGKALFRLASRGVPARERLAVWRRSASRTG